MKKYQIKCMFYYGNEITINEVNGKKISDMTMKEAMKAYAEVRQMHSGCDVLLLSIENGCKKIEMKSSVETKISQLIKDISYNLDELEKEFEYSHNRHAVSEKEISIFKHKLEFLYEGNESISDFRKLLLKRRIAKKESLIASAHKENLCRIKEIFGNIKKQFDKKEVDYEQIGKLCELSYQPTTGKNIVSKKISDDETVYYKITTQTANSIKNKRIAKQKSDEAISLTNSYVINKKKEEDEYLRKPSRKITYPKNNELVKMRTKAKAEKNYKFVKDMPEKNQFWCWKN